MTTNRGTPDPLASVAFDVPPEGWNLGAGSNHGDRRASSEGVVDDGSQLRGY
jgi:hypothetical protein